MKHRVAKKNLCWFPRKEEVNRETAEEQVMLALGFWIQCFRQKEDQILNCGSISTETCHMKWLD